MSRMTRPTLEFLRSNLEKLSLAQNGLRKLVDAMEKADASEASEKVDGSKGFEKSVKRCLAYVKDCEAKIHF